MADSSAAYSVLTQQQTDEEIAEDGESDAVGIEGQALGTRQQQAHQQVLLEAGDPGTEYILHGRHHSR